jgi:UrcA family protein
MVTRLHGRTTIALAGAAASLAFLSAPAAAQQGVIYVQTAPPENLRIERVGYGDLNLATRTGEQSLHRRVGRAVERVCLYDNSRWYGLGEPDYNYCSWGAWNRARPQMYSAAYRARQLAYYRGY